MILASILAIYFVFIMYKQSNDLARMRRIAQDGRIRRGLLSYRDIVNISHQWHPDGHYYNRLARYWEPSDQFVSCRYYLSTNGRLYHHHIIGGHKTIEFVSYCPAKESLRYLVYNKTSIFYTYKLMFSFNTYTYTNQLSGGIL